MAATLAAAGIHARSRLCCALSGGLDSVVLLHLLLAVRERFGFSLQAAHVHHGLSPAASQWSAFCSRLCAALDVPLSAFEVHVVRDDPDGLEAAARKARHAALNAIDCDWLVFGHHLDDQAETTLFRLFRGAGVRGAAAMAALEAGVDGRAGRLRPLLNSRRASIHAWALENGLQWVEDESNAELRFARNDIRHRILPAIEDSFPAASEALARAAGHFREASDLLDELAADDARACGGQVIRCDLLLHLSDARVANLLRWKLRQAGGVPPSQARLLEVIRQLRSASADQPLRLVMGGLTCCVYRGALWFESDDLLSASPSVWRGSALPEEGVVWGAGRVRFAACAGRGIDRRKVDEAGVLQLSTRTPGLRLRLADDRPARTFKNLCQEAAIPAWIRSRLPVLEIDGKVAWIGGIGVDAAFACPPQAEGILPEWLPLSS